MKIQTTAALSAVLVELELKAALVQQHEREAIQVMLNALKHHQRDKVLLGFKEALDWNELRELMLDAIHTLRSQMRLTFVVDAWFLLELIGYLTPRNDEEICYVTGLSIGKLKSLSRICRVKLEKQSAVYALATAKSCSDALMEILEQGNNLHAMAHSHPGRDSRATCPSSVDTGYLERIQRAGSDVVGVIVTRDGYVRFFSVEKPFQVFVRGTGVTQIEEEVYHVVLSKEN